MFDDEDAVQKIDPSYTSRVAEIFNVTLKSLGIGLEFLDDDEEVRVLNDDDVKQHELDGKAIMCTDYQFYLLERASEIRNEILEDNPVLTEIKLKEMIENVMKKRRYINGPLNEEIGELEISLKKELDEEYNRLMEEKRQKESEEQQTEESDIETTEEITKSIEETSNEE